MYDNLNDAHRYLYSTIAYWDGRPVYVGDFRHGEGRTIEACLYDLPLGPGEGVWRNIGDPKFNCTKYVLGYANHDGNVAFVSRRPSRGTAQGLAGTNMSFKGNIDRFGDNYNSALRSKGVADMLVGKYPTIAEARQKLVDNPNVKAVAFDRYFAIRRHGMFNNLFFLEYKGEEVSWSPDQEFVLPETFKYLAEVCNEKGCLKAA